MKSKGKMVTDMGDDKDMKSMMEGMPGSEKTGMPKGSSKGGGSKKGK